MPYLSLPAGTFKDVALQVFINMNTNSKPLSLYDIIVAEVESVTEKSLHSLENDLSDACPAIQAPRVVSDLILATSALLQDKPPSTRGMIEMNKELLLANWPKLKRGLSKMVSFLEGERIFDEARLPSSSVLSVVAAAYDGVPDDGDFLGKAEKLLRRYLWSAFFTDRYENAATTRAFADFRAMKALLANPCFTDTQITTVPVLNRVEHPIVNVCGIR